ncbi:hypothetical protein DAI22_03g259000 [Oryza sativa Japonica Group]|nr:hypothetical protein DAI22_03g259000 [Oryza sativa Japonica Group]
MVTSTPIQYHYSSSPEITKEVPTGWFRDEIVADFSVPRGVFPCYFVRERVIQQRAVVVAAWSEENSEEH